VILSRRIGTEVPNQPDAENPAMTPQLTIETPCRRVSDPGRSAENQGNSMKGKKLVTKSVAFWLCCYPAWADLQWQHHGSPIHQWALVPGETVTIQLYCDNPTARHYDVTMGSASNSVVTIDSVGPFFLAGDWASATCLSPDWWQLHCAWNPASPQPISVWGVHWDVTMHGKADGSQTLLSGTPGMYSILTVVVNTNANDARLAIDRSGGTVVLSWPSDGSGWTLERTPSLTAGSARWTELAPPYQTNAAGFLVAVTNTSNPMFYRLRKSGL